PNPSQPRWGCAFFHPPIPNVAAERQRWAGGRNRFAVEKSGIALRSRLIVCTTNLIKDSSSLPDASLTSILQPGRDPKDCGRKNKHMISRRASAQSWKNTSLLPDQ